MKQQAGFFYGDRKDHTELRPLKHRGRPSPSRIGCGCGCELMAIPHCVKLIDEHLFMYSKYDPVLDRAIVLMLLMLLLALVDR